MENPDRIVYNGKAVYPIVWGLNKPEAITMIIPHIIDQFVWNSIVSRLGAGPEGIRINRIKENRLEPRILD